MTDFNTVQSNKISVWVHLALLTFDGIGGMLHNTYRGTQGQLRHIIQTVYHFNAVIFLIIPLIWPVLLLKSLTVQGQWPLSRNALKKVSALFYSSQHASSIATREKKKISVNSSNGKEKATDSPVWFALVDPAVHATNLHPIL